MPSHSHSEAIGVPEERIEGFLEKVTKEGQNLTVGSEGVSFFYEDPSGASLAVHSTTSGEILCVTPYFTDENFSTVNFTAVIVDEECPYCSAVHIEIQEKGETLYSMGVQLPHIQTIKDKMPQAPSSISLSMTLFAEEFYICETDEEYEEAMKEEEELEGVSLPLPGLIPVGLFTEEDLDEGQLPRPEIGRAHV